jgi:CCDC81-like prokaryotic HU domain 1/CCDC81-like prokaryotic HU domain 2
MDIIIANEIKELLYEQQTVIIPGLGAFVASYKSAMVEPLQGQFVPPNFSIRFNENLLVNDGVLKDFIQKKYTMPAIEANRVIDNFVKESQLALELHELVAIPEVGRLYRDNTGKIQFLPDQTNFNTESFGLTNLQFYPISRPRIDQEQYIPPAIKQPNITVVPKVSIFEPSSPFLEPVVEVQPSTEVVGNVETTTRQVEVGSSPEPIKSQPFFSKERMTDMMPTAFVLLLLCLASIIYMRDNAKTKGPQLISNTVQHVNENPNTTSSPVVIAPPATPPTTVIPSDGTGGGNGVPNQTLNVQPQAPEVVKEDNPQRTALRIIGNFKEKSNTRKLVRRISEAGYAVFSRQNANGTTTIGLYIPFKNQGDLDESVANLTKKFGQLYTFKKK